MKYSAVLFLLFAISLTAAAQKPKSQTKTSKPPTKAKLTGGKIVPQKISAEKIGSETQEFEKAVTLTDAAQRVKALQKFIENFPASGEKIRAQELIVSARAQLGDEKLQAGEREKGLEFFKLAVKEAPKPMSEKLFADVILQFPTNLFFRGERAGAFDVADMIEEKAEGNAKQMLGLATFYLAIESASAARRLANKAIEIAAASETEKSNLPVAYQTLGLANRLGFQLEESAAAYSKALELDPESGVSKRSLAEMKRATGKFEEAVALYRELIERDENDLAAKTGLTLSLFDAGRRAEAEAEMSKTLEANAGNLPLLVGAAYWYAAKGEGAKAVELAREALKIEPRYTWGYIALGRGFMAQNLPLEAERALLTARNFGSFPTINYELAAARLQAGFYREAADELRKNFALKNGTLETRLGGRITVEAEDFIKLLALERQASIFAPNAADTADTAQKLKSLLAFSQEINSKEENTEAISAAADEFVKGDDKMKIHRQLFVAARLLEKKKALPKVLELTQAAVSGVDSALDVPNPSAAVMADELYETRNLAISRNEVLIVPEVPRQTLSVILRGRIEELAGWTLYQQENTADAVTRLKRAVSVLPEKSSWWRSSVWRLGAALEADGKQAEALESYIKAYNSAEQPDAAKYSVIESLYQKITGSVEGLEQKIGARPAGISDTIAGVSETPDANAEYKTAAQPENPPTNVEEKPTTATDSTETKLPETKAKNDETKNANESETDEQKVSAAPETAVTPEASPSPSPAVDETPPVEENPARKDEKTTESEEQTGKETKEIPTEPTAVKKISEKTENLTRVDGNQTSKNEIDLQTETKPEASPQTLETTQNNSQETKPPSEKSSEDSSTEKLPKKPEKLAVVVTDNTLPKPAPKPKNTGQANAASKSEFEPVIINLPAKETAEKPKPRRGILDNPPVYKKEKSESEINPQRDDKNQEPPVNSDSAPPPATRPRVVIEDKLKNASNGNPQCRITVSQENISLINNGGSIGILVEVENGGANGELTAVTSSPDDVRVAPDAEFGTTPGRVFFIVKSISEKKGFYTVTVESACGKKEIQVRVR